MLRMWVDEFIRQQQGQKSTVLPSPTLKVLDELKADKQASKPSHSPSPPPKTAALLSQPRTTVVTTTMTTSKTAPPPPAAPPKTTVYFTINPSGPVVVAAAPKPPAAATVLAAASEPTEEVGETLTFAEMEKRAILRQQQAALAERKAAAPPRAVLLPERDSNTIAPRQFILMPVVSVGDIGSSNQFVSIAPKGFGGSTGTRHQQQNVVITSLAPLPAASESAARPGTESMAPKAVSSLVDSKGRPAISGPLQTVTVSTPSGQISLTKVSEV
jgi:hypothetical protein